MTDVSDNYYTLDRHSNDFDDTCVTVLTKSCVRAINVYIASTTQTKPSTSIERGRKHDITINMLKMKVGQTSEKEARHVEETHKMTFFHLRTCMLLRTG